jgi:hypothetical protein
MIRSGNNLVVRGQWGKLGPDPTSFMLGRLGEIIGSTMRAYSLPATAAFLGGMALGAAGMCKVDPTWYGPL